MPRLVVGGRGVRAQRLQPKSMGLNSGSPAMGCVALGQFLNFSVSWLLHLYDGDNDTTFLTGLM